MCGIAGVLSRTEKVKSDELLSMRQKLTHRGPDDAGLWLDETGCVGLAHQRLAVIDISKAGCQPMSDDKKRFQIVFNGEIYNFLALRRELEAFGWRFRTGTDTEVILYA